MLTEGNMKVSTNTMLKKEQESSLGQMARDILDDSIKTSSMAKERWHGQTERNLKDDGLTVSKMAEECLQNKMVQDMKAIT